MSIFDESIQKSDKIVYLDRLSSLKRKAGIVPIKSEMRTANAKIEVNSPHLQNNICLHCRYARIKNAYNSSGKVGTIIVCHITNKKKKKVVLASGLGRMIGLAHSACNNELLTY